MRVLFISNCLIAGAVAHKMVEEGHDVKIFIKDKLGRRNFDNIIAHTDDWKTELSWVGKDGLIVFDDVGYGKAQDRLRREGYKVFGGTQMTDMLELDREYGQKIFREYGMKTVPLIDFDNIEDAIIYAQNNKGSWVVKQNDHKHRQISYVNNDDESEDTISFLKNCLLNKKFADAKITLQEKVDGVEIGVGRYFNGKNWVGPIEYNIEHKYFMAGDLGPMTSEMGTLAWYSTDESNKLYTETLSKMKDYLAKNNFIGDFEINFIVNKDGIFPIEATPRFGTPICHLHSEIHQSPWGEYLYALACGKDYDLKWTKGYGIVILCALPPFPYQKRSKENLFYGMKIFFDKLTEEEMEHIHLEEVSKRANGEYYISDTEGYIFYVSGVAESVGEAQENVYKIAKKVILPKMMYRNDIGSKFEREDYKKLKEWGCMD